LRDESDYYHSAARNDEEELPPPPSPGRTKSKGWFSRWTALGAQTEDNNNHNDENNNDDNEFEEDYHEMPDPNSPPIPSAARKTFPLSPRRKVHPSSLAPSSKATYSSLMVDNNSNISTNGHGSTAQQQSASSFTAASSSPTPEDALKQDCSFFFRSDDNNNQNQKRQQFYGFKAIRRNTNQNSDLFHYSNAVDCLSPPVLQHYRTQYAQLNHPDYDAAAYRRDRHGSDDDDDMYEDDNDGHDLQLIDDDDDDNNIDNNYTESSRFHRHIVHSDSVAASSLLFYQDGRRLMRLPRDQVRLLADPDLEPGVLSVEQCRPPKVIAIAGATTGAAATPTTNDDCVVVDDPSSAWHQHPLRYVLTVDDGLYRQIMTEMSPQQTQCCGIWGCLRRDQERVDIRVAYGLLTVILILLGINTLLERLQ